MLFSFDEWLQVGITNGYCSGVYCDTHDPHPIDCKDEIQQKLDEYGEWDFCWLVVHIKEI